MLQAMGSQSDMTERLNRTVSEGAGVLVDFVDDYAQK